MSERMNKERAKQVLEEELRLAQSQLDFLEFTNEFGIKPTEVQNKKQRVEKYAQALDYAIHCISAKDRADKQVIEQLEHIKKIYDYDLSEEQTQALDIAIESIDNEWIDVRDRLPSSSNIYLVSYKKDTDYWKVDSVYFDYEKYEWDDHEKLKDKIIAWKPLPQPYKRKESE